MLSFSLDWNCVIAVENREPAGASVVALSDAYRAKRADVALLATSASESLRDNTFPGSYGHFEDRVKSAGLEDLPALQTPAVWSLTFWDRSYWVDIEKDRQAKAAIWAVRFPTIEEEPWHRLGARTFAEIVHTPEMKKWRNAWCDGHNLVTHIDHNRDAFVTTNTDDYQRNSGMLRQLGIRTILTPDEARATVEPHFKLR